MCIRDRFVSDKIVDLAAEQVADGVNGQRRFSGFVLHFNFIGVFLARFFAYLGKRRANDVAARCV